MSIAAVAWRFQTPLRQTCKVLCAGSHFPAGYHYTKQVLVERNLVNNVQLIRAATEHEWMELAPTVHVAIPFMERFHSEFIHAASQLRLIQQMGVGLEGVDIDAASQKGIAVANIPAYGTGNAQATAEHALLLSMMLLRKVQTDLPQRIQDGMLGGFPLPKTLYQLRVTVVGYGAVGSTLCQYLSSLGSNVTVVRRRNWKDCPPVKDVIEGGGTIRTADCLEDLLSTTNLLILACPITSENNHLMNKHRIQMLPRGALLVNVGRGPLVEYDAIREAIESGHIAGFASDVGVGHVSKPSEPWDPHDALTQHPHTIFTPHAGGICELVMRNMTQIAVDSIERVVTGKPPLNWANAPVGNS